MMKTVNVTQGQSISHAYEEETLEAKAVWFQSLPISERMKVFCEFTDLALELNPDLPNYKDAQPTHGRIQILSNA